MPKGKRKNLRDRVVSPGGPCLIPGQLKAQLQGPSLRQRMISFVPFRGQPGLMNADNAIAKCGVYYSFAELPQAGDKKRRLV
jgi:hypothetical protein